MNIGQQSKEQLMEKLKHAFAYAMKRQSFSKVQIVKNAKNVCVFGLGRYFEEAFLKQDVRNRFGVRYLCDNNIERLRTLEGDPRYKGLSFLTPKELCRLEDVAVIFMLGNPNSAVRQFSSVWGGVNCIAYNDLVLDEVMGAQTSQEWFAAQQERMEQAFLLMEDDLSRTVYVNVFCNRVAPQFADYTYEDLCVQPQYFPHDVITLTEEECFVDCGAYDGDTFAAFTKIRNKFARYWGFEMDAHNYSRLREHVKKSGYTQAECFPYGVWKETTDLSYGRMSSADSYSIFNTRELSRTHAVALDDFLADEKITMIKMDIEGAEMNALAGAEGILKKQAPKLAVCVYHKQEDLFAIIQYIHSFDTEQHSYKYSLRHHSDQITETVLYAVPKEDT